MTSPKMFIDSELYSIFKQYSRKGDAKAAAEIARRTGLFKHIRVVETRNLVTIHLLPQPIQKVVV